jgi:hypothetical protein
LSSVPYAIKAIIIKVQRKHGHEDLVLSQLNPFAIVRHGNMDAKLFLAFFQLAYRLSGSRYICVQAERGAVWQRQDGHVSAAQQNVSAFHDGFVVSDKNPHTQNKLNFMITNKRNTHDLRISRDLH